ncbi:MAG TPA: DUF6600 domain-containing protein, partial [Polyangiaceae bacterium]|nr:DUF6600 domain-containing protein [Polyangiaceae bacterium]
PLDPPPPDFQSPPPSGPAAPGDDEVDADVDAADVEDGPSQQRAVSEFSPHLDPYGRWIDDPFYGRVWVPSQAIVGVGFRPYVSAGHWELTAADEWFWVSDYPFGWVTFHYGRWAWLSGGGWGWVPGYVWAPAWVEFRVGSGDYLGWGPAPPYAVWRSGVFISLGVHRPVPYIYCPTSYVFAPALQRHIIYDRHRARRLAVQTHHYRPAHVAGSVRVRSLPPREARIPARHVPARRVIAEPRGSYSATDYRRRRVDTGAYGSRYLSAAPAPRYQAEPRSSQRGTDPRGTDRRYEIRRPSVAPRRAPGAPRASERAWRSRSGQGRQEVSGYQRRVAPPARNAAPRYYRAAPVAPARQRVAPSVAQPERRGDGRRSGGGGRAAAPAPQRSRSAPPAPQRSRPSDDRGRSR